MKLLDRHDHEAYMELLEEDLSRYILHLLSFAEVLKDYRIVSEAVRYLPSADLTKEVQIHIDAVLDYYRSRGDILQISEQRYVCLPPYAVDRQGQEKTNRAPLFGNRRIEEELSRRLETLGASIQETKVYEELSDEGQPEWSKVLLIGLEREITYPEGVWDEVRTILNELGIACLDLGVLRSNLPAIENLVLPTDEQLCSAPHQPQEYQLYDASLSCPFQGGRWSPLKTWDDLGEALVRWRPPEADTDIVLRGQRFFIHMHEARVSEIDYEEALLWQFYFDHKMQRPVLWTCQVTGSHYEICIDGRLPNLVGQWLRLLSGQAPKRKNYKQYFLIPRSVDLAPLTQVAEQLGTKVTI